MSEIFFELKLVIRVSPIFTAESSAQPIMDAGSPQTEPGIIPVRSNGYASGNEPSHRTTSPECQFPRTAQHLVAKSEKCFGHSGKDNIAGSRAFMNGPAA